MDDYSTNILNDSKNEWSILLINTITSHIIEGFRSIFNESLEICEKNDEVDKYLMTYQNLLSRIPNWNQTIIDTEKKRILNVSKCMYLEDLITCVHVTQLKILSCVNVSSEPKKIEINIPNISLFIHNVYINIARKLYSNIYLFEIDIPPLEQQKRNREFELLVQTCIMNTIRERIPIEELLRKYIDETQEIDVRKIESIIENKKIEDKVEDIDTNKAENIDTNKSEDIDTNNIEDIDTNNIDTNNIEDIDTNNIDTNNVEDIEYNNIKDDDSNNFDDYKFKNKDLKPLNDDFEPINLNTEQDGREKKKEYKIEEINPLDEDIETNKNNQELKLSWDPSIVDNKIKIGEVIKNNDDFILDVEEL